MRKALQINEDECNGRDDADYACKLMNISIVLRKTSISSTEKEEVDEMMAKGCAMAERLVARDPGNHQLQCLAAMAKNNLSVLTPSVESARRALKAMVKSKGEDSLEAITARVSYARILGRKGSETKDVKTIAKARREHEKAPATAQRVLGPRHPLSQKEFPTGA